MSVMRRPMRSFIRIYAWHMRTEPRLRKGSGSAPRPTPNSQRIGRVSAAGVRLRSEAPLRSDANPDHPQHAPCKGMAKDFEFAVRRRDSGSPGLRVAPPRDILVSDSQELKHPDLRCAPFFLSENHQLIPTQYGSTYSAILDLRGPCGSGQGFRDATPLALRDRCCKVHSVFLLRGFFLTGAHHWSKGNTDQQSFR